MDDDRSDKVNAKWMWDTKTLLCLLDGLKNKTRDKE
jgi:hypothetical protein